MNKKFYTRVHQGVTFNFLELPKTNFFKVEVINSLGSNVERLIDIKCNKKIYGMSHLVEHLSFKSTQAYSTNELMEILSNKGSYNASTSYNQVRYYFETTSANMDLALNLVCNYAFNDLSRVTTDEFDTEKSVVCNEVKRYNDDSQTMFSFNMESNYAKLHPSDNILGDAEVIKNFKLKDVQALKQLFLTKGTNTVNIVFNPEIISASDLVTRFTSIKSTFQFTYNNNFIKSFDTQDYTEYNTVSKRTDFSTITTDNQSSQALISLVIDNPKKINTFELKTALTYLERYAPETSLNRIIREDNGLTYSLDFTTDFFVSSTIPSNRRIVFMCDTSPDTKQDLLHYFQESCSASVATFDESKFNTFKDAVSLKNNLNRMSLKSYFSLFEWATVFPELFEKYSEKLKENVDEVLDSLYDENLSYSRMKVVLDKILKKILKNKVVLLTNDTN